jgi:iron complex outermembrane recepter protein
VEYELKVTSKFAITAGVKAANYALALNQYQDNGKTVGCLGGGVAAKDPVTGAPICVGGTAFTSHSIDWNSWLPSIAARYRVQRNWSVYAQFGEGSITPPTAAFDVPGGNVTTPLKPQIAKTYQTGSVIKRNRWTLDVDAYYVHYGSGYQNYTDPGTGEPVFTQTGPLNTKGIEMESNIAIGRGFAFYVNGSIGNAKYEGGPYYPNGGLWVAGTPKNTQTFMVLYQHKNWDAGIVNKRVGPMYNDNGSLPYKNPISGVTLTFPVDQAVSIDPFDVTNVFLNYTIKNNSWMRGSKLGLAVTNLADSHNIVGVTPAVAATAATPYVYSPYDQINILPGRSIMATFALGYAPRR